MSPLDTLTSDQNEIMEKFRRRMRDSLPPEMHDDNLVFYRFLKARDFNIAKAETMLKQNLTWRKLHQVETILETYNCSEVFRTYIQPSLIGFDKVGDIVRYLPAGEIDPEDVLRCMKFTDYTKSLIYFMENEKIVLKTENDKRGRIFYQTILIIDLDNLSHQTVFYESTRKLLKEFCLILIQNYPESMKAVFIINAPAYYQLLYSAVKLFMSDAQQRKVHVLKRNDPKDALVNLIDPDVLPEFLGGNRDDSSIHRGGAIPPRYYLTDEDREFKNPSDVKRTTVSARWKSEVLIDVKNVGSLIRWEFKSNKDIGFGLFLQESTGDTEIVPIEKYNFLDGTETGVHKTRSAGRYIIVFDNSYSKVTSKNVQYCINVIEP